MSLADPSPPPSQERDEDLLTRAEASAYLRLYHIRLKPQSLARLWSVGGDGPCCVHIRRKPFYPRGELRRWAESQQTRLRRSAREDAPLQAPPEASEDRHGPLD